MNDKYLRIASEEAYASPGLVAGYRRLLEEGVSDIGFTRLWKHHFRPSYDRMISLLCSLDHQRLEDMERVGVDHQVVAPTAPGFELFDPSEGRDLAMECNELIARACRESPDKFTGLAGVYLQDPDFSVQEIRRASRELDLKGVVINSHARGRYLDEDEFDAVIKAVVEEDLAIYLHPNTPNNEMIGPLLERGLEGAVFGFGMDTSLHLLRMLFGGVFDRYPSLRLVLGHMGEGIPLSLYRLDYYARTNAALRRYPDAHQLELLPSDYFRRNIWCTTSGFAWEPALRLVRDGIGPNRTLYAMDYPYQVHKEELEFHEKLELPADELRYLFESGAKEVFRIDSV